MSGDEVADEVGDEVGDEVEVVLALGANLGDRAATLQSALQQLADREGIAVQAVSALVETAPVGGPAQPAYLNAVAVLRTTLGPNALLAACHEIEADHGRARASVHPSAQVRWGARTLDLDLIAYGQPGSASEVVLDDGELTLPHPRAHQRAFVLAPWAQLQPDAVLRLPNGQVRPVRELLDGATDRSGLRPALEGTL